MKLEIILLCFILIVVTIALCLLYTVEAKVYGVYGESGWFCVDTENRTLDYVMRTTMHELAHVMIEEERVHFGLQ